MVKLSLFCVFAFSALVIDVNPNPLADIKELLGHIRTVAPTKNNGQDVIFNPSETLDQLEQIKDVLSPTQEESTNPEILQFLDTVASVIDNFIANVCLGLLICLDDSGVNIDFDEFLK